MTLETLFTNIANAIRAKKGSSATIKPTNFATEIQNLPSQGTYQAKTVTPTSATQTVSPDTGYDALSSVTVNGDADLTANNIKKDVQIFGVTGSYEPTLQAKTVTPTANPQTINPDSQYDGLSSVTINGDNDLVASNIKKDVEIFGVTGTYEGGGTNNANMDVNALETQTSTTSNNFLLNKCLTKIPAINTSGWTSTAFLYNNCRNVEEIDLNIDTSNVTNMSNMFNYAGYTSSVFNLDLSHIDTSNVTDMSNMFSYGPMKDTLLSRKYELNLDSFYTPKLTNMEAMFYNSGNQNALWKVYMNNFDTSKVTTMYTTFNYFGATYKVVDGINTNSYLYFDVFDLSSCVNVSSMFSGCKYLELHGSMRNLGKAYTQARANYSNYTWNFSNMQVLTHDNLTDIINGLYDLNITYDVAGGGTLYSQKLTLGSTNLAKLSAEEIAVATAKGWNVS